LQVESNEKAAALERALNAEAKLAKLTQHAGDTLRVRGLAFRKVCAARAAELSARDRACMHTLQAHITVLAP
jgi:hypothetical protein